MLTNFFYSCVCSVITINCWEFRGGLVVSAFTAAARVQSLVWEHRSHVKPLHTMAKKIKKKKKEKELILEVKLVGSSCFKGFWCVLLKCPTQIYCLDIVDYKSF